MSMGESLERGFFRVGARDFDIDLAENMYIVTGDGLQTVPIRDTGALNLRQVAISGRPGQSGAVLVGLMDN